MKKIQPRDYQKECLASIRAAVKSGQKRALVVMASGLGKTFTSAFAVEDFFSNRPFGHVLILCHSDKILRQSKDKFKDYYGDEYSYGMYVNTKKTMRPTDFLFATFQTMKERHKEFSKNAFDYIIIDEAHHSHAKTFFPTIRYFEPSFLLGLTATPNRLDGQNIEEIYGEPIFNLNFFEANNRGLIAQCDYHVMLDNLSEEKINELLASKEKVSIAQLNRRIFAPKRDEEIIRLIESYADQQKNPKTIIFCKSIEHARKISGLIGDSAALVHSNQSDSINNIALEQFRSGVIRVIVSVQMLNEGIDIPDANIIVFLRNTVSETVFYQQLGRGVRLSPKKETVIVLDFVSNCERMGMVTNLKRLLSGRQEKECNSSVSHRTQSFIINIPEIEFLSQKVNLMAILNKIRHEWTNEELINSLRKKIDELGRMPTRDEIDADETMASNTTYLSRFGGLEAAARLVGVTPNKVTYTDEELLEKLRLKSQSLNGEPLTVQMIETDPSMPSVPLYTKRFNGMMKACKLAKVPYRAKCKRGFTKESLIEICKNEAIRLQRPLATTDFKYSKDLPSIGVLYKYFNSVEELNNAIGAQKLFEQPPTKSGWTKQRASEALIAACKKYGHILTVAEIQAEKGLPSMCILAGLFGTRSKDEIMNQLGVRSILKAAGINPEKSRIRITDQVLLDNLRSLAQQYGKTPTARMIDASKQCASTQTYLMRFGSLNNAFNAAGLVDMTLIGDN